MDDIGPVRFEFGNDGPSVIIAGIDGSETSLRAAAFAGGLARRERARLVCVFVNTLPALVALAGAPISPDDDVAAWLRRLVDEGAAYHGMSVELIVTKGDPFAELTRIAGELRADLVVVGASTHAGHRLIGSLALRLVRAGRWPVTVVP